LGATKDHEFVINECKKAGKEVGIAVAPNESVFQALSCNHKIDIIQILAVNPGLSGQTAQESAFERIKEVRNFCKSCKIEVDGGMNKDTAKKAVAAGANIIVAANAIFKDNNVEKNLKDFYGSLN
jgi:ribulose-phosphate 3-epimerase